MTLKEQIKGYQDEMLECIARLVKYNSVEGEPLPGMPFGEEPAKVLAEALSIAEEMGFKTVNLDNYCGYAEMGEGDDIIGIAAHLDIVPVGDGWHYDPLSLTIEGDRVYGRGTTDDKGPVIMALYAMKIIRDLDIPLNKRVRLIMGCNEETGSLCMAHYNKVEEPITMGFTPDASFPCIHGEKGMFGMTATSKNTKIIYAEGGIVFNAVCDHCTIVIPASEIDVEALKAELAKTPLVSFDVTSSGDEVTIKSEGVAAHSMVPFLGINATGHIMDALAKAGFEDDFVDFYNSRIGLSCDGSGCGLKLSDDYGDLTMNNGIIKMEDGNIVCTIDNRFPVTYTTSDLEKACAPYMEDEKGRLDIMMKVEPLFFSPESDVVKALYSAWVDVTGDTEHKPEVIGGGTYAKSLPGIVAFGPEMPGVDYRIHNADEFMEISGMQTSTEIYVKAIENMLKL